MFLSLDRQSSSQSNWILEFVQKTANVPCVVFARRLVPLSTVERRQVSHENLKSDDASQLSFQGVPRNGLGRPSVPKELVQRTTRWLYGRWRDDVWAVGSGRRIHLLRLFFTDSTRLPPETGRFWSPRGAQCRAFGIPGTRRTLSPTCGCAPDADPSAPRGVHSLDTGTVST